MPVNYQQLKRPKNVISLMVGRELNHFYPTQGCSGTEGDLQSPPSFWPPPIRRMCRFNFIGEILGLASLIGTGRTELPRLLIGAEKTTGTTILKNQEVHIDSPVTAVGCGIAYLPEDRKNLALILPMTTQKIFR